MSRIGKHSAWLLPLVGAFILFTFLFSFFQTTQTQTAFAFEESDIKLSEQSSLPLMSRLLPSLMASYEITATKRDSLFDDINMNSGVDEGDTLEYVIVLENRGTLSATNVLFTDTIDANTTLSQIDGLDFKSTPIASNDSYGSLGNVGIFVSASNGILQNDSDPDGSGGLTLVSFQTPSANGGKVAVAGTGFFSYTPPAGFEGTDTFNYVVQDGDGNQDGATVTISVSGLVWFIDNSAVAAGDGRLQTPFNTLAAFEAINGNGGGTDPEAGDVIFLHEAGSGDYTGGLALENAQILLGEGISVSVEAGAGLTLPPFSRPLPATGGTNPVIANAAGNGLTLAENNVLGGFDVGDTPSNIGIVDNGGTVGNLIINEVGVRGTGKAFDIRNGGVLNVNLEAVRVTASTSGGFHLENVTGSTTLAGIDISTTGGTGMFVSNAGTLTVLGAGNRINSVDGTAVNISNSTISASDATFASLSSSDATSGIILNSTGTVGGLHVTGDGGAVTQGGNASGGTISNATGDAIVVTNSANLRLVDIRVDTPTNRGLDISEISGVSRLDQITVHNVDSAGMNAVRVNNFNTSDATFTVDNSQFSESDTGVPLVLFQFRDAIGTTTINIEDSRWVDNDPISFEIIAHDGGGVVTSGNLIHNFTGNSVVDVDIDGRGETNHFCNGAATCTFNVSGNIYRNLGKVGGANIGMINIGTNQETISGTPGLFKMIISNNQLSNTDGAAISNRRGIYVVNRHSGTLADMEVILDGNTIDDTGNREALYIFNQGDTITTDVFVQNNRFGTGDIMGTTANNVGGSQDGIYIRNIRGQMNLLVDNNTIQTDTTAADQIIEVEADNATSNISATVTNNVFASSINSFAFFEITLDGNSFCLDIRDNSSAGGTKPWLLDNNNTGGTYTVEGAGVGPVTGAQLQAAPHNNVGGFNVQGTINNNNDSNCTEPVVSSLLPTEIVVEAAETAVSHPQSFNPYLEITALTDASPTSLSSEPVVEIIDNKAALTAKPAFSGETINATLDTLDSGQMVTITLRATVDMGLSGVTQVCNQATITGDVGINTVSDDPDTVDSNDATCTQLAATDVAISKIVTNDVGDSGSAVAANSGETITYTIEATNNGPIILSSGGTVTDVLPSGITLVSFSATEGTADDSGDPNLLWTLGEMGVGEVQTATVVATIDIGQGGASLLNEAALTQINEIESNSANDVDTAVVNVRGTDLQLTKTAANSVVDVGDVVTFTITIDNNGPDSTSGVEVMDMFPASLTYGGVDSISSGNYNSGTAVWTVNDASFNNGETHTLVLTGTVPASAAGTDVTNTAVITASDAEDGNSANNTDDATLSVRLIDLEIVKTVSNATPIVGEIVTYTLTVTNFGPDVAQNVAISDTIPANLTYVPASISGGDINSDGLDPLLGWGFFTLPVGSPEVVQFSVTVDGGSTGLTIENIADVLTDGIYELDYSNNQDSVSLTVSDVDLAVSKTAVQTRELDSSSTITYTLRVSNPGPAAVTNLIVMDDLPPEVNFVSATGDGSFSNPADAWTIGDLAANDSATLTIVVTTTESIGTMITNTASILTVDQDDLNSSNDSDTVTITLSEDETDLVLSKSASTSTPAEGSQFSYILTIVNDGPDDATGIIVTDNLPPEVNFVSSLTVDGSYSDGTGEWLVGDLAIGESASLTIIVTSTETSGTVITNFASVTAVDQTDPDLSSNNDSATVTMRPPITFVYLPLILTPSTGPDLIITDFTVAANSVTVEITNDGDEPVINDFWVDVYVNPATVPTAVNQTVQTLGVDGFVWGVEGVVLNPGDSITVTLNDVYFSSDESTAVLPLTVGLPVYAQVDSANISTNYGAVEENHERLNGTYNNIVMSNIK